MHVQLFDLWRRRCSGHDGEDRGALGHSFLQDRRAEHYGLVGDGSQYDGQPLLADRDDPVALPGADGALPTTSPGPSAGWARRPLGSRGRSESPSVSIPRTTDA